jgi:hypothetical protein
MRARDELAPRAAPARGRVRAGDSRARERGGERAHEPLSDADTPARVALNNGWLAPSNEIGWQINGVGPVSGRHRDDAIAVLTGANPRTLYGMQTVEGISPIVWKALLSARFRPQGSRRAPRRRAAPMPGSGRAARAGASDAP